MEPKNTGEASLIVDLLQIHKLFSWRLYRVDLLGFLVAWAMVAAFIVFYLWLATW
jgi:hypothetical protein